MSVNTSTAKATVGSLFSVITNTGESVIGILNVANTYVGKAQLAADDSYKRQLVESKIDNAVHQEQAIRKAAQDEAESAMRAKEFMLKSEGHKEAYQQSYDRFSSLFSST
jgi:hypothetical protein